jgi:hypothetical protein
MSVFEDAANKIGQIAIEAVKLELAAQGHRLTGALIDSVTYQVKQTATGALIEGLLLDYGIPVNTGVPAANIPYTRKANLGTFRKTGFRRSGGKASKYIAGLKLFAKLRFRVNEREATRIAFAIANKHKKEGMPTQASKRFSSTGKRTGAIQDGLANVDDKIQEVINEVMTAYINIIFVEAFKSNLPDVKVQ